MNVVIDTEVQEEAKQLVAWYAERNPDAACRLEGQITSAIERIARNPHDFPLMEMRGNPGDVRRARILDFPVVVIYQVLPQDVLIVAVAHTSRRPGYWRRRISR